MQRERSAVVVLGRKGVVLEQVVDRNRALVLDVGVGAAHRVLIERDRNQTVGSLVDVRPERVIAGAAYACRLIID